MSHQCVNINIKDIQIVIESITFHGFMYIDNIPLIPTKKNPCTVVKYMLEKDFLDMTGPESNILKVTQNGEMLRTVKVRTVSSLTKAFTMKMEKKVMKYGTSDNPFLMSKGIFEFQLDDDLTMAVCVNRMCTKETLNTFHISLAFVSNDIMIDTIDFKNCMIPLMKEGCIKHIYQEKYTITCYGRQILEFLHDINK